MPRRKVTVSVMIDRPGKTAPRRVVEVGDLRIELAGVGRVQRQAPDRIVDPSARFGDRARQRLVLGEEGRQVGAQSHAGGAGQRREIEDKVGRIGIGQIQGVGEDQAPLRIGVADLNGEAGAGADDVAGAEGVAGDRVLDARHDRSFHP